MDWPRGKPVSIKLLPQKRWFEGMKTFLWKQIFQPGRKKDFIPKSPMAEYLIMEKINDRYWTNHKTFIIEQIFMPDKNSVKLKM